LSIGIRELTCDPYRKIPWRLSKFQKARQRKRLRAVDTVVSVVDQALAKKGMEIKPVERWKAEMPKEQEMVPRDKYTIFDRKEKKYRKAIHSTQLPVPIDDEPDILTLHRITQVDESFSACQPPWILELRWDGAGCTILRLWILHCMAGVYGRLMYDGDKYVYCRMNVSVSFPLP
jgi:hypothetical protein